MEFQAQRKYHGTAEQPRVRRSVRIMTTFASIHSHSRMLEDEGSARFYMTVQTGFFIRLCLFGHARSRCHAPGRGERAVRIVAIGTGHEPFLDAMFEGHGELRPYIRVTVIAQGELCCPEQRAWGP